MQRSGGRIKEIDALRVIAALCVVMLHVLGYLLALDASAATRWLAQAGIEVLRFSRQIFMFATGLVLAYVYRERRVSWAGFWWRRGKALVLPYAAWTVIYLWFLHRISLDGAAWLGDLKVIGTALLTGDAYYHLYYVVVTLQFYLVFPLLLALARRLRGRTTGLAVLFIGAGYLGLMGVYARYPFALPLPGGVRFSGPLEALWNNRDRLLGSYFPYYFFGVVAGLNLQPWRELVQRGRRYLLATGLALASYLLYQLQAQVQRGGQSFGIFVTVFRPAMFLYSLAAVGLLYLLAMAAVGQREDSGDAACGVIESLAPYTYGIYLAHPLVLTLLEQHLFARLAGALAPEIWFGPVLVAGLWSAGVYLTFHLLRLVDGTSVGEWLFGLRRRPAAPVRPGDQQPVPTLPLLQYERTIGP